MSGTNGNASSMGDWMSGNTSPQTLLSNFLNDDSSSQSFAEYMAENGNGRLPAESERPKMVAGVKVEGGETCTDLLNYQQRAQNSVGVCKPSSHGGLSERMAASGFRVPNLDTSRVVSAPNVMLSPTSLLESPVFLANSMAQLSPTTGKFAFDQNNEGNLFSHSDNGEDHLLEDIPEAFAFKLPLGSCSLPVANFERTVVPGTKQQLSTPDARVFIQSGKSAQTVNVEDQLANFYSQQRGYLQVKGATEDMMLNQKLSDSLVGSENPPVIDDQQDNEADQKLETSSAALGTPAEDGYNWRKYGQKQVKGSEYPRSYYKCTHPNCQVKKKVERSHEGHITEIIYKGAHNHAKPPPNRRSGVPTSYPLNDTLVDGQEQPNSQLGYGRPIWSSTQNTGGQGSQGDGLEVTSSDFVASESCDPSTSMQQIQDGPRISADAIDGSSILSNEEDEDDQANRASLSLGCEGDGDETESKRRKFEASAMEVSAASRAVREPRIVVQTTSEVDILDDGYRWRKYGQKVVKGNPNPRSYYKCTNPGCTVRKHVERASHDLKSVITTYEGKHNHEVPAARNSGHASAPPSNSTLSSTITPHSLMRRPEPPQDSLVRFATHAPLPTFGLPGREQLGPATNFSFSMGQPGLTNLTVAGLRPLSSPIKMPILPSFNPYMVHRQPTEQGLVVPKGEPKDEAAPDSGLPLPNGASAYHPMMGRLPLGHQM